MKLQPYCIHLVGQVDRLLAGSPQQLPVVAHTRSG